MEKIAQIMNDYSSRMKNDREVPQFLQKEMEGIWLSAEDFDRGITLLIDGLRDEKNYITDLLERP